MTKKWASACLSVRKIQKQDCKKDTFDCRHKSHHDENCSFCSRRLFYFTRSYIRLLYTSLYLSSLSCSFYSSTIRTKRTMSIVCRRTIFLQHVRFSSTCPILYTYVYRYYGRWNHASSSIVQSLWSRGWRRQVASTLVEWVSARNEILCRDLLRSRCSHREWFLALDHVRYFSK